MSLSVSIRVPEGALTSLRDRLHQQVASSRSQMVQSATEAALTTIIETVPVRTGETQGEWQTESDRVRSTPPSSPSEHTSLQTAINRVEQMIYIEYGTTHMAPRGIVRSTLSSLLTQIRSFFHFSA